MAPLFSTRNIPRQARSHHESDDAVEPGALSLQQLRLTLGMQGQRLLTKVGRICSPRTIHWLNAATNYLEVGRWFKERGLRPKHVHRSHYELFRLAAEQLTGKKLLYLEFGVWKGWSIRRWAGYHTNPESRFHGFDSFEGLPSRWNALTGKGAYNSAGLIPEVSDSRVHFFKGWFEDTLPLYTPPDHDALFINFDADLYESTRTALQAVAPYVKKGTFLYFDEFSDRANEMRAFLEFIEQYDVRFTVFGCTPHLTRVIFEVESVGLKPGP